MRGAILVIVLSLAGRIVALGAGVKVYVYDLPSKFNYELFDEVRCGWHVRGFNHFYNGMGSPVDFLPDQQTLRNNDQYTLEIVVHDRMLTSDNRVYNKADADMMYVPFYIAYALHKLILDDMWDLDTQQVWLKSLTMDLLDHLRKVEGVTDDMWSKHFITIGREEGMLSGGRFTLLSDPDLAPLTKMLRIHYRQDCMTNIYSPWTYNQTCPMEHNLGVVVAPQVATVHAVAGEPFPWQAQYDRLFLATFVGNDRQRRHEIIEQLRPHNCKNCRLELSDNPKYIDGPTVEQIIVAYSLSQFCLQPWGDGPLRRGIYDSIALGCIPVFFVHARKPWDTFIEYESFSVMIDFKDQNKIIEVLEGISLEKKTQLRQNLEKYAQYFQWSFSSPTIMDAFDAMMIEISYISELRNNRNSGISSTKRVEHCSQCSAFAERFASSIDAQRNIPEPMYRISECGVGRDTLKSDQFLLAVSGAPNFTPLRLVTRVFGSGFTRFAGNFSCRGKSWAWIITAFFAALTAAGELASAVNDQLNSDPAFAAAGCTATFTSGLQISCPSPAPSLLLAAEDYNVQIKFEDEEWQGLEVAQINGLKIVDAGCEIHCHCSDDEYCDVGGTCQLECADCSSGVSIDGTCPICDATRCDGSEVAEICDNGLDDDANGNIDCADWACIDLQTCKCGSNAVHPTVPGRLIGHVLDHFMGMADVQECCAECFENKKCVGWAYRSNRRICQTFAKGVAQHKNVGMPPWVRAAKRCRNFPVSWVDQFSNDCSDHELNPTLCALESGEVVSDPSALHVCCICGGGKWA